MTPYVASLVFEDPTPEGVVNNRIVKRLFEISLVTILEQEKKQRFFRILLLVGKKMVATWRHLDRFQSIQATLVANAHKRLPTDPNQPMEVDTAQDLFIEFDEFLVQVKSCLDYLVKIPTAILGKNVWSISTFGDKGQKVLRALERNLPRDLQVHAEGLRDLVLSKHLPWLEWAISLRDSLNHLIEDDFAFEAFAVGWEERDGVWRIHVPQVERDVTAAEAMTQLWNNLIVLVEDFIAGFLGMRMKPGYVLFHGPASPGVDSPWQITTKEEMDRVLALVRELSQNSKGEDQPFESD